MDEATKQCKANPAPWFLFRKRNFLYLLPNFQACKFLWLTERANRWLTHRLLVCQCIILLSPKAKESFILIRKKYTVYVKKYLRNSDGLHCLLFAGISLAYKWNLQNGSLPWEKQSSKFLEAKASLHVQYVRCVQKRSKPPSLCISAVPLDLSNCFILKFSA